MSEFQTIEVTGTIANLSPVETLTEGVDYTLPAGCDETNSFAYLVNSHLSGRGQSSGGGNQNLANITCTVESSAIATSLEVRRDTTANDCQFTLHILCFTGSTDSPLRMQVLLHELLQFPIPTDQVDTSDFASTDTSRVLPFITGQRCDQEARTLQHFGFFTAGAPSAGNVSDFKVTVSRGSSDVAVSAICTVAILQFGPGWDALRRIPFRLDDPYKPSVTPGTPMEAWDVTSTETYGILDITQATLPSSGLTLGLPPFRDIREVAFHVQYRIELNTTQGNDDAHVMAEIDVGRLTDSAHADHNASPETHLIVRARTLTTSNLKYTVVWALSPGLGARGMNVQHLTRFFDNNLGGGEEEIDDTDDPTPHPWSPTYAGVSSATNACILGHQVNSDGSGAGVPRGYTDFQLPSTSVLRMVRSESGQEERQYVQVVEWPSHYVWMGGRMVAWEQRRAGLKDWEQDFAGAAAQEQRSGKASTSEQSGPSLVAWEQRRGGITEWQGD